jgi:hypothetical protein
MTMRYAHLAPAHKVNAVNVLDNALNRSAEAVVDEPSTAQLLHSVAARIQKSTYTTV